MTLAMQMRALPEAVVDLAYRIYASDPLNALDRLTESLSDHDLRMLATIALRDGPEAAERFYRSRPRRLRVVGSLRRPAGARS